MSDIDDCASLEIEASTSSNSTRNSKKHTFVQSILNTNDRRILHSHGSRIREKLSQVPLLEKRDFIKNWIIAHSPARSSEKSCPLSPILGISPAKRSPQSPILGYQWKRIKREANSKENCRVSLNEKFQQAKPDLHVTGRITIKNENTLFGHCTNSDSDKTLISVTSPMLSKITKSPALNASRVSCRSYRLAKSKNSGKFDAESTLKWNARRSLIRESSKGPEALSLSSPLGERNERLRIQNTLNASNEPLQKFTELLVDESPLELEIISSSSKIPETLSLSTTVNEYEETEVVSKTRNELKEEEIRKEERHHTPSCLSRVKLKEETSFGDVRRNRVRKFSSSSDGLSMSPPLGKNKLMDVKFNKSSRTRAGNSLAVIESPGTLQSFDHLSTIAESSKLPSTVSVSSQFDENLVPRSLNSAMRLPLPLPLVSNVPTGVKPLNSSWITAKGSSTKIARIANQRCIDRPSNIREESCKLSNVLSERIDAESNTTNAPEDDIKIESDSDATVSDFIENAETQNAAVLLQNTSRVAKRDRSQDRPSPIVEPISKSHRDASCDSDETYYSDGDSVPRLRATALASLKNSQRISQTTSHSLEGRVSANRSEMLISQAGSPLRHSNSEPLANAKIFAAMNNSNKKKRKAKKGSLVAMLQAIVSSQVSNLRIWRYQMSQPEFKNARTQFVTLMIRERETRYGRHYLTASVIEDSHKLLKSLFESESILLSEKSESSSGIKTVMLMIVPEIIGVVKIRAASTLKLYPPWEIMDQRRKILSIKYFKVIAANDDNIEGETTKIREEKRVVEEFECPCIRANELVDSCRVKFSNTKPSVMQAMFGS